MTPLLASQLITQEKRLKDAGLFAFLGKYVLTTIGTYLSDRFKTKN